MKPATKLMLLISLAGTFAAAQTVPAGTFKHIIILVMENRTPDNLFGSTPGIGAQCGGEDPFEAGVDIENGGYVKGQQNPICTIATHLNAGTDPGHQYADWTTDYDSGHMDGFCHKDPGTCAEYAFVDKSDVQPYFDIATGYGFANYMFQTNEGPSFEAHQFLFTGTSAPVAPNDPNNYYQWFVADNAVPDTNSGCPVSSGPYPDWVNPVGAEKGDPRQTGKNECYPHDSLVTSATECANNHCDKGFSWAYYTLTPDFIWTAPAGIPEVCYGENDLNYLGQPCGGTINGGTEWNNHVRLPGVNGYSGAPIFDDLYNCNLPSISWVIPDVQWSDHGGETGPYGPSWVGDIIDAVGGGMAGSTCNGTNSGKYWTTEPTAIFVVWDDWGGWFDHVQPPVVYEGKIVNNQPVCTSDKAPNAWGCGYVYGFRVPLLVVSPYTQAGYVSGACSGGTCQNNVFPYRHDFGSILAFTEYNFNMPFIDVSGDKGYADFNALDWSPDHKTTVPLSDFFGLNNQRNFTGITTEKPYTYFQGAYEATGTVPTGPDDDSE